MGMSNQNGHLPETRRLEKVRQPKRIKKAISLIITLLAAVAFVSLYTEAQDGPKKLKGFDAQIVSNAERMIEEGRQTFRDDTFGDEAFWGAMLRLHEAIKGADLGGVGDGLTPAMALALGLKVDVDALPNRLIRDLVKGLLLTDGEKDDLVQYLLSL